MTAEKVNPFKPPIEKPRCVVARARDTMDIEMQGYFDDALAGGASPERIAAVIGHAASTVRRHQYGECPCVR